MSIAPAPPVAEEMKTTSLAQDRLVKILSASRLLEPERAAQAAQQAGRTGRWLGSEIVEQGLVAAHDLVAALSKELGILAVDLGSYPVNLDSVQLIPQEVARRLSLLAMSQTETHLFLAMANPLDTESVALIEEQTGLKVERMVATEREVQEAIERLYAQAERLAQATPEEQAAPDEKPKAARAVAHVDDLLEIMIRRGASDLHLSTGSPPVIRVDGELLRLDYETLTPSKMQELVYSIISDEHIAQFERHRELDFAYSVAGLARFRANIHRQRGSVGAVFRVVPVDPPSLDDLGMPPVVKALCQRPRGLILVTGPTGHGKTTTLAAMIKEVNTTRSCHIVTIEDPIEFLHRNEKSLITQREVGDDTESFNTALRHVLRQDPDVILIGEMRDLETIAAAVTAAETGHLVFATLHTTSSAQTIDRVIDVFPPHQQQQIRLQLSTVLEAVLCQALLPKASGKGRVCAQEILVATPAIRNLIREGKTHQMTSVMQSSAQSGMQTLDQALKQLVSSRQISLEVAQSCSSDPSELEAFLKS